MSELEVELSTIEAIVKQNRKYQDSILGSSGWVKQFEEDHVALLDSNRWLERYREDQALLLSSQWLKTFEDNRDRIFGTSQLLKEYREKQTSFFGASLLLKEFRENKASLLGTSQFLEQLKDNRASLLNTSEWLKQLRQDHIAVLNSSQWLKPLREDAFEFNQIADQTRYFQKIIDQVCAGSRTDWCRTFNDFIENTEVSETLSESESKELEAVGRSGFNLSGLDDRLLAVVIFFVKEVMLPFLVSMAAAYYFNHLQEIENQFKTAQTPREVNQAVRQKTTPDLDFLSDYRVVVGSNLRVRAAPNRVNGHIEDLLPLGKLIEVLDSSQRSWLYIGYESEDEYIEGWVARRYTSRLK